ncbi:hypothetical protein [Falsiroseomonas oryziterrae]|uniref:hypothetical protein n=1 Tax=Falsiroseomonas oryziterrae TaxID=2911368 RepID=UPI001F3935B0|nr:hypothetical protein [Roseomonas sp. NPKOSM-4]
MAGRSAAARRRNLFLLAAGLVWLVGAGVTLLGLTGAATAWPAWVRIPFDGVLLFVVANTAVVGLILAIWSNLEVRALARFRAATDVVAEWTVTPEA